jgi:hypothetical protein
MVRSAGGQPLADLTKPMITANLDISCMKDPYYRKTTPTADETTV